MADVLIRKERAGSCSLGYTWPEDGSVVEVAYEDAVQLLALHDGGFSVATPPAQPVEPVDGGDQTPVPPAPVVPEPETPVIDPTPDPEPSPDSDPAPAAQAAPAAKQESRRRPARKTAD